MVIRSKDVRQSESIELLEPEVVELAEEAGETPVATVNLRLMRDVQLTTTGKVTGKSYHWSGAGSITPVDEPDVELLLQRGVHKSCCGSLSKSYFEIVGD